MKILYPFILLTLLFAPAITVDVIDKTAELIRKADIHELAKSFATAIDITVLDDENIYSNSQAEQLLNNFFSKNQPHSMQILHRISSNSNYRYGVVMLTTTTGVYRIAFSLKKFEGEFKLTEIRIERKKQNNR